MQEILLTVDRFEDAVALVEQTKVTSPGYVIIGGLQGNEGVVVARDPESTNHTVWLTDQNWFVI